MKIAVCIGIAVFMLADTFVMWCLCRVGGLADRRAESSAAHEDGNGKGKEPPHQTT